MDEKNSVKLLQIPSSKLTKEKLEELFEEMSHLIESPGIVGVAMVLIGPDDIFCRWSGNSNPLSLIGAVEVLKNNLVSSVHE